MPSAADTEQSYKKDEWVVVEYDRKMYRGIVTAVVGSDVEVTVMEVTGGAEKFWKWLVEEDNMCYTRNLVLHYIDPADVAWSRGQYSFKGLPVSMESKLSFVEPGRRWAHSPSPSKAPGISYQGTMKTSVRMLKILSGL